MIELRLLPETSPGPSFYRLAGRRLSSDVPLPLPLAPRDVPLRAPRFPSPPGPIYDGDGWIGGRLRRVHAESTGDGYLLRVEGGAGLRLSADGRRVECLDPAVPLAERLELALGPGLVLALALDGVYCLHAAAAQRDDARGGQAIVFVGPSGAGKSTLAAHLDRRPGWRRLADDILPIAVDDAGSVAALPHFPQLKLDSVARNLGAGDPPERVDLTAIVELGEDETIRHLPSQGVDAVLLLIRSTVAARLFPRSLLAEHLEVCRRIAARVEVGQLLYPRRLDALSEVEERLAALESAKNP